MAKQDTNIDLPGEYWQEPSERLMWWVCSIPPYYCRNASTQDNTDDLSRDQTWLGPNYFNGATYDHDISPGIKFAYTIGSGSQASATYSNAVTFWSSSAAGQAALVNLNKGNGVYNTKTDKAGECLRPGTFSIGDARDPMHVGPYPIDKTLFPNDDGDILLLMTGSDVMGGSSGSQYTADDQRAYNILFYYTGSEEADINHLLGSITGAELGSYSANDRRTFIGSAKYGHIFVGASGSGASKDHLMWWPFTWDENTSTNIFSSNNN